MLPGVDIKNDFYIRIKSLDTFFIKIILSLKSYFVHAFWQYNIFL